MKDTHTAKKGFSFKERKKCKIQRKNVCLGKYHKRWDLILNEIFFPYVCVLQVMNLFLGHEVFVNNFSIFL